MLPTSNLPALKENSLAAKGFIAAPSVAAACGASEIVREGKSVLDEY